VLYWCRVIEKREMPLGVISDFIEHHSIKESSSPSAQAKTQTTNCKKKRPQSTRQSQSKRTNTSLSKCQEETPRVSTRPFRLLALSCARTTVIDLGRFQRVYYPEGSTFPAPYPLHHGWLDWYRSPKGEVLVRLLRTTLRLLALSMMSTAVLELIYLQEKERAGA
jgi:hypothetical protein